MDRKRYRDWPVCRTGGHSSRRRPEQVLNAEKLSSAREIHTKLMNGLDEFLVAAGSPQLALAGTTGQRPPPHASVAPYSPRRDTTGR